MRSPFVTALATHLDDARALAAAEPIPPSWTSLPRGAVIPLIAHGEKGLVALRLLRDDDWRAALEGPVSSDDATDDALRLAADALSALAHDLQGPLSVACGFVELALAEAPGEADGLRRALSSLHHLAAMQSLRARRAPRDLGRGPTWARDALEGPLAVLAAEFRRRRVVLDVSAPPDVSVPLSEDVAVCAMLHLTENALSAAQLGAPRAAIAFDDTDEAFSIRVEDEGPGLDAAARDAAGRRGWSTRGGTGGYGLWVLRTIAHRLGAALSLSPRTPRGTVARFAVRRPAPR